MFLSTPPVSPAGLPALAIASSDSMLPWLQNNPPKVFVPGSFADTLRKASETSNAFMLLGLAYGSPISFLGVLTFFFEDWPQMLADMVVGAVTLSTVSLRIERKNYIPLLTRGVH